MSKRNLLNLFLLFLIGCQPSSFKHATTTQQKGVPQLIVYTQTPYHLSKEQTLGALVRYTYKPLTQTHSLNKQRSLSVLHDHSHRFTSLQQRIHYRQQVWKTQPYFELTTDHQVLYSWIFYLPNPPYTDFQLDISVGKTIAKCGYIEYTYSIHYPKQHKITIQTLRQTLQKKAIQHIKQLETLNFSVFCQNP